LDALLGPAPGSGVVAARLTSLLADLAATTAPALVVAAMVHAEIATLRPFVAGNEVVALVAQRIVLIERGLDPGSHAVVEVGHLQAMAAYGPALAAYDAGGAGGIAAWVRHCGEAVTVGSAEGLAICESIGR